MESPAAPGSSDAKPVDRRISLGKYVKRMSSVFKREKSTEKGSKTVTSPTDTPTAIPIDQPRGESPKEQVTKEHVTPTTSSAVPPPPVMTTKQLDRRTMQQERARALFAKYGLTLEAHEWVAAPAPASAVTVQRVEKAIRMRVHRSCHRCGTIFGADKVCLQCEHKRCSTCPRYPKKKTQEERLKEKEAAEKPKRKKVLTIVTRSGNELAYSPAKQRVRRNCHKCEALFVPPTSTICDSCRHIRCTKCPREPAKLTKWPTGYPGDVEPDSDEEIEQQLEKFRRTWRKPRARVRWECEKCHNQFVNGSPQCPGCGHERCDKCTRSPVKKVKKEEQLDPQIVAAVEAKLRAMGVDDDSLSSVVEAT